MIHLLIIKSKLFSLYLTFQFLDSIIYIYISVSLFSNSSMYSYDDDDESRALLYYASPETDIKSNKQSDLYGQIIEKKRVGVSMSYLMLFSYIPTHTHFSCCFILLYICIYLSIYLYIFAYHSCCFSRLSFLHFLSFLW